MVTQEILTIQLGHYANFVGTHWWNIQETNFSYDPLNPSEINSDVLYREGELQKNITYTPRLLIADLKGAFGYLSEEGNLLDVFQTDNQAPEILWEENRLEIAKRPTANKSPFIQSLEKAASSEENITYDLENETNTWVDYLVPRFHARTINVINEYEHGSRDQPFDIFSYGQNLWKTNNFSEDFTDKIRAYAEECNLMQGFQVLVDADDGFGGLAASLIQYLKDEYGKSIITWPVFDSSHRDPTQSDNIKLINTVLLWHQLGEYSSLFSPLCCGTDGWPTPGAPRIFNHVTYKADLKYHTSALLATAVDTLSLRYRNKRYPMSVLSDICADLGKFGRKAVATSLSLPFPIFSNQDLIDMLDDLDGSCPWTSLTPRCNISVDNVMQSLALRGISEKRLKGPMQESNEQIKKFAYKCSSVHEMMSLYLDSTCHFSASHLTNIEQVLKVNDPYPKLFNSNIMEDGSLSKKLRMEEIKSVPVMAGLHTGKFMSKMYDSLYKGVEQKVRSLRRFNAFILSGLEEDEFKESVNDLLNCKDNYEERDI
ncbi:protein misato [Phymastichus coffea]|uniref:protein misato n=1 Tax=Phymastichus coffea TaxID=108790 RepID=UPI00273AC709|nr:protein misato [Phymastichus coffea]XP_058788777.1 protein misato [Phymastichus coffea]